MPRLTPAQCRLPAHRAVFVRWSGAELTANVIGGQRGLRARSECELHLPADLAPAEPADCDRCKAGFAGLRFPAAKRAGLMSAEDRGCGLDRPVRVGGLPRHRRRRRRIRTRTTAQRQRLAEVLVVPGVESAP